MTQFTPDEALALLITGEIIERGLALPSIALPTAMRIARERRGHSLLDAETRERLSKNTGLLSRS